MTAAAATPLTRGSRQDRSGRPAPAQAPGIRPNGLSAGVPADVFLSADTYRHAQIGCPAMPTTWNHNVRDPNLLRARNRPLGRSGAGLLGRLGLWALGHRTLERCPPGSVQRQRLLGGVTVRGIAVLTAGGGVQSAQLGQALLLGRQGGLEGVGELGVVHRDDAEARLQLDDFHLGPGQLEIDRFCHFLPLIPYGATAQSSNTLEITTHGPPRLCLKPWSWLGEPLTV